MECIYYKCSTCGFVHQEPSYWSDHAADEKIEMPHINLETKEMCNDIEMSLVTES